MAWSATSRFDIEPAPTGLALVQDLLNTAAAGPAPDLLSEVDSAEVWLSAALAEWSSATGRPVAEVVLDAEALQELRAFRDNLRGLITGAQEPAPETVPDAEPESPSTAARDGACDLPAGAAVLELAKDGSVYLRPQETGHEMLVTLVLAALFEGQQTDKRRRLKTCRNPRCQVAFYDHSRNASGVWHSVRTCGNVSNLRAHRARRRTEQT
ncbi:CGNR zinc finger domain-containing protein [Kribbella alba]|uniref:CGNR zinc finger domain-containing protein n=1 Tax=Kribbella alba TaxID=190197 RepID=A0ABN2FHS9_9ACTN